MPVTDGPAETRQDVTAPAHPAPPRFQPARRPPVPSYGSPVSLYYTSASNPTPESYHYVKGKRVARMPAHVVEVIKQGLEQHPNSTAAIMYKISAATRVLSVFIWPCLALATCSSLAGDPDAPPLPRDKPGGGEYTVLVAVGYDSMVRPFQKYVFERPWRWVQPAKVVFYGEGRVVASQKLRKRPT